MAFLISLFTAKVGKQDVFNGPICCSCRHKVTLPQFPVHPKDQISLVHCQRELAHEHTQHTNNALPHMLCTKTHKHVYCEDTVLCATHTHTNLTICPAFSHPHETHHVYPDKDTKEGHPPNTNCPPSKVRTPRPCLLWLGTGL